MHESTPRQLPVTHALHVLWQCLKYLIEQGARGDTGVHESSNSAFLRSFRAP